METKIKDHMTTMPKTIGHDISVGKVRQMMQEMSCHHLPVLDGGQLVGIISDRDLKASEAFKQGDDTPTEDLMMDEVIVVDPEVEVKEAIQILLKEKVGSLIVRAKDGQPWGIFTTTDALRLLVDTL